MEAAIRSVSRTDIKDGMKNPKHEIRNSKQIQNPGGKTRNDAGRDKKRHDWFFS